ncbi:MAG: acetyl-CoA decarbonylase/synthase complex subunit gamma [Deltaproteobacteria bacterium]|nr:MAG: acetyl-CoA decarbonylase/synthase complex subunit gamma [Deltaproteobacteria bacterium]
MPWKAISPIEVYKLLPKTNCKKCGEENCMAFAVKLVNMETKLELCKPLLEEAKYKKNYEKLKEMLTPPVREVELRSDKKVVKIGGEYVLHRHELTYINPPPIAIDVDDTMSKEELIKRINFAENFKYTYIGRELNLDLIAIRSVSNDPEVFKKTVNFVASNTSLPLVLCTLNPKVMEAGVSTLPNGKPLLYAATKDNWKEMADIALKNKLPLAVFSPGNLDMLISLAKTLLKMGISEIALDPGTFVGFNGLRTTIDYFTMLRWKACNEDYELAGWPLIGTPLTAWKMVDGDSQAKAWWEMITASMLIVRYADMLIMHSLEGWVYLPLVMLRFNIYTDPRKPVAVEPGLRIIGNPDEMSPVMLTGNFALTYYIVSGDIEAGKIDCYLLLADTEGIAVECAVPGRKLLPDNVAEILKSSGIEEKVKHRILIIPGKAARLAGDIEDTTGWRVLVGPLDSKDIPKFIEDKWKPENIKKLMES